MTADRLAQAMRTARIMHNSDQQELVCLPPAEFKVIRESIESIAAHRSQAPAEGDDTSWTEQPQIVRNLLESCANWLESRSHCQMLRIQPDPEEGGGYASLMREYAKNLRELNAVLTANVQPKGIADNFRGARRRDAAEATLQRLGYKWHGAELWEPPLGQAPVPAPGMTPLSDQLEATRKALGQERTPAYGDALALCRRLEAAQVPAPAPAVLAGEPYIKAGQYVGPPGCDNSFDLYRAGQAPAPDPVVRAHVRGLAPGRIDELDVLRPLPQGTHLLYAAPVQAPAVAQPIPPGYRVVRLVQRAYSTKRGAIYGGSASTAEETPLFIVEAEWFGESQPPVQGSK